jgi:uncharacterized protein (DUF1800 family)
MLLSLMGALLGAPLDAQAPMTAQDSAWHLLHRFAWGPTPGQVDAVASRGALAWLDEQLAVPSVDDPRLASTLRERFPVLTKSPADMVALFTLAQQQLAAAARLRPEPGTPPPAGTQPRTALNLRSDLRALTLEVPQVMVVRAVESEHQVAEVLADFWFNHFNVFAGKGLVRPYLQSYVEEVIRRHALGRFEDLLVATAMHPAMLFYLDNAQSVAEGARPPNLERLQRIQRQNQRPGQAARADSLQRAMAQRIPTGINENYARELLELHTLGVDGGYTQRDIEDVARIFTGWSIQRPGQGVGFVFNAWAHDRGAKSVLGEAFPAGRGEDEGVRLLRWLAIHPATMHHVSAKLCARFVADSPPDGCVDDAVRAWRQSNGDIRAVVRAIGHSPDFWAPRNFGSKIKSPLEFVVSAVRALGGSVGQGPTLSQAVARLGQPIYGQAAPTGYPETQEDWVNSGALLNRMNLAMTLASGRLAGGGAAGAPLGGGEGGAEAVVEAINRGVFHGRLSETTRSVILTELADLQDPRQLRATALGLALGGPDFQRQ